MKYAIHILAALALVACAGGQNRKDDDATAKRAEPFGHVRCPPGYAEYPRYSGRCVPIEGYGPSRRGPAVGLPEVETPSLPGRLTQ